MNRAFRKRALLLLVPLLWVQCQPAPKFPDPSIAFTVLPDYGLGDPGRLDPIEGRVTGARPGEKVVLYARSELWWVQPLASKPFTGVEPDSTWKNRTHPGTAYAALLVNAHFNPSPRVDALPGKGGDVRAIALARGAVIPKTPRKDLAFAGYEWQVQQVSYNPGGSSNRYDPDNAWTDRTGFLHLRISGSPGHWNSAEVILPKSLGYGTYRFVIRDLSHLEPAVVFTMLTGDRVESSAQMGIEISKWGETHIRNGQFVIQPYYVPANTVQFQIPQGEVTFMVRWTLGRAFFKAFQGQTATWESDTVREHLFTSGVPLAGNESLHMNLYVFDRTKNPLRNPSEVVVEKFEYLP